MLVIALKIFTVLLIAGLIGILFALQMERFEHLKRQLAISAICVFFTGAAMVVYLEQIEPFIWESPADAKKKKKRGQQASIQQSLEEASNADRNARQAVQEGAAAAQQAVQEQAAAAAYAAGKAKRTGNRLLDCDTCPEMVVIPAGTFTMGARQDEADAQPNEHPAIAGVTLKSFAIGRFEITQDQYQLFLTATGRRPGASCDTGNGRVLGYNVLKPGFDQTGWNPAVCVTWDEAQAYAAWLSKTTGRRYRLPSAAEWEFAARARGDGPFHTGGLITQEQARIALDRKKAGSVQVGSFSSNSFGLHDVHGNAAEWVEDCWHSSLHGMPKDGSAWKQQVGCERVVKGGAWYDAPGATRLAARMPAAPTLASNGIGFRIAREID